MMPIHMGPNSYFPSNRPPHQDSEASHGNAERTGIRAEGRLPSNQQYHSSCAVAHGGQEYWNRAHQGEASGPWSRSNPSGLQDLGHSRFEPPQIANQIMHLGNGTIVGGQSTEDFANRSRVSLCYQCCKRIPLQTLLDTRKESCDDTSCRRTQEARMLFISMPQNAAEACHDFQVFLDWWMEKVDLDANETVERRAKDRVLEMRDDIP